MSVLQKDHIEKEGARRQCRRAAPFPCPGESRTMNIYESYPFPVIESLDDILPAIEGSRVFTVYTKDGYIVADYLTQGLDVFGDFTSIGEEEAHKYLLRREVRGLKFAMDGRLIARPFHKFFNLNQAPETDISVIDWSQPHSCHEKVDGSLVHPARIGDRMVFMTRSGITPFATDALSFAEAHKARYLDLCRDAMDEGLLPLFEWCSGDRRKQRTVIAYDKPRLVLTRLRDQRSGRYSTSAETSVLAYRYGVPTAFTHSPVEDPVAFAEMVRTMKGAEGFVVYFAGGAAVKVKALDYVLRSKAFDEIATEKNIIMSILENREDDVLPFLLREDAVALSRFSTAVRQGLSQTAKDIAERAAGLMLEVEGDRRAFAEAVPSRFTDVERAAALRAGFPKEQDSVSSAEAAIRKQILLHSGSGPRLEPMRPLWGNFHWRDFQNA